VVKTGETFAVNWPLVPFIGTHTEVGNTTAGLLLERVTSVPPIGAGALRVTVQRSVPVPVYETTPQEIALNVTETGVWPEPLRAMTAVPFGEELLEKINCPAAAPTDAGSNRTLRVADCDGINVSGNTAPLSEKPLPVKEGALMTTGALPTEDKLRDWAEGVFSATLPKAKLAELIASVGTYAFSCSPKLMDTPPSLAVT
jgi:hypothetical protein